MQVFSNFRDQFETYLTSQQFNRQPKSLYEPFSYMLQLGGKRVRPVSLLASADAFGASIEEALPAAFAIELFHNFTLVHDDIMDQALIRRGQPTVEEAFGTNTAILSGDAMFVTAYDYFMGYAQLKLMLELFNLTSKQVCEGQQLDMEFESREAVSIAEYIEMITLKTAVLLGCSLQLGALIANASQADQASIYAFGKNLGISFQIKDDLLDAYSDQSFGKQIGGDILQNKKTYLTITALNHADPEQRKQLLELMKNKSIEPQQKIDQVLEIYEKLDVKNRTEQASEDYYHLSLEALNQIDSIDISPFQQFAKELLNRKL